MVIGFSIEAAQQNYLHQAVVPPPSEVEIQE